MAASRNLVNLASCPPHCHSHRVVPLGRRPGLVAAASRNATAASRNATTDEELDEGLPASSSVLSCSSPPLPPLWERVGCTAAAASMIAASLFLADPSFAFKGGGPYGQQVTRGQDLSGKDFSGQSLVKQDFKTSILRQANFKGAKLLGASFFDADLTGADLSDADLRGADFSLANVSKVNLTNANLEGALTTGNTSFKGSVIYGADFTDVPLRDDQREYLCKIADGVNPVTENSTRDTLLCQ